MKILLKVSTICLILLISGQEIYSQNHPPVAVNDTIYVLAGQQYLINIVSNDYDQDGDSIYIADELNGGEDFYNVINNIPNGLKVQISYNASGVYKKYYRIADSYLDTSNNATVVFVVANKCLDTLETGNISAVFCPMGWDFTNEINNNKNFKFPKNQNKSTLAFELFKLGALDVNNSIYISVPSYLSTVNRPGHGPVRNSGSEVRDSVWNRTWKIYRNDIEYVKNNYTSTNFNPSQAIIDWPAHGDTTNGENFRIAPFHDENNDGIYNPHDGDYPEINGDIAIFMVFNTSNYSSGAFQNMANVEIHLMAYTFICTHAQEVNNSIFYELNIINRSNTSYHDLYLQLMSDFDIGNPYNDLIACDTNRNCFYSFNGQNFDSIYNSFQPVHSTTILDKPILSFITSSLYSVLPTIYSPYLILNDLVQYNLMSGILPDSSHLTIGANGINGVIATNYMNTGDPITGIGWLDSLGTSFPFNDKKGYATLGSFTFYSGDTISFNYVSTIAIDSINPSQLSSIELLRSYIDNLHTYFENDSLPCGGSFSGFDQPVKNSDITIFPVPTKDLISVITCKNLEKSNFFITDLNGKIIMKGNISNQFSEINLTTLPSGIYVLKLMNDQFQATRKFVKL